MIAGETFRVYRVEDVGDGDTLTTVVDLELDVLRRLRVRLAIVDAPEYRGPRANVAAATAATTFALGWITDRHWWPGQRGSLPPVRPALALTLYETRSGRYVETFGRHVVDLYDTTTGETLSSALLRAGHATVWEDR